MCGIFGSINHAGKYITGMEKTIKELMWAGTIRGTDATGIYALTKDKRVVWSKDVEDGWLFQISNDPAKKIMRNAEEHPYIIGHNRAATLGSASDPKFAHPIIISPKLGLVHNGTLTSWPSKYGPSEKRVAHDSTAIAQLISGEGVQEFVNSTEGAYSLVWHDWEDNTLHFLRNDERPMAFVETENVLFYGSELAMVMWIIQRNGFKALKWYYTEPMNHYTFELGGSAPKVEKVTKTHTYRRRGRFPEEGEHAVFGYSPTHQGTSPGWRDQPRGGTNDRPVLPALERPRAEGERERLQRFMEGDNEGDESKTAAENGTGSGSVPPFQESPGAKVVSLHKKPRVTPLTRYKHWVPDTWVIFSVSDYTQPVQKGDSLVYTLTGIPHHTNLKENNVVIRAAIRVDDLPPTRVQASKKYFIGKVANIISIPKDDLIVIWVKDVGESEMDDPEWANIRKPPKPEKTEPSVVSQTTKNTHGQENCHHCKGSFPKSKMQQILEQVLDAKKKTATFSFLFCDKCMEAYADDRMKVVPPVVQQCEPQRAIITRLAA